MSTNVRVPLALLKRLYSALGAKISTHGSDEGEYDLFRETELLISKADAASPKLTWRRPRAGRWLAVTNSKSLVIAADGEGRRRLFIVTVDEQFRGTCLSLPKAKSFCEEVLRK